MSATPDVIYPKKVTEISQCWKSVHLVNHDSSKPEKHHSADASSSSDELNTKVRKPYTITKQRERWTETEHQKFLEALKLYGRAWRHIEEYIGTKTAVQIRSHAQKFFSKLEREASTGSLTGKLPDIAIPPPRPKRKPIHPYPKKAGSSLPLVEDDRREAIDLSSACEGVAHSESFQMGFTGMSQELGAGSVAENPAPNGQLFDRQGSVKIFGKAVSISEVHEGVGFGDDKSVPTKLRSAAQPSSSKGFPSFVEVKNNADRFSKTAMHVDRSVSQLEATQPEGIGESLVRACCCNSIAGTEIVVGDSVKCSDGELKGRGGGVQGKHEGCLLAAGLKEGERGNVQPSHVRNPAILNWMNSVLHCQNSNLISPISPSGMMTDVPSGNSLSYWQFIQASAMNYAAYTAAIAAAAVAGWKAPNSGDKDTNTSVNEYQVRAPPSLPWWPFGRFVSPVYVPHPPNAVRQGEIKAPIELGGVKEVGISEESHFPLGVPVAGLKTTEIPDSCCEPPLDGGCKVNERMMDHPITKSLTQVCKTPETSCLTQTSIKCLPDLERQLHAAAMIMPAKEKSSDIEVKDTFRSPQTAYTSSDDFEEPGKKPREGSSSGSNTPALRYQSSEWDAPILLESQKKDLHNRSEDIEDGWSDTFRKLPQQCVANTAELLNQRVKNAEKGRLPQQRDARHSGGGDSKRFKSCAHETELRKEVSQEGRKAFQALFASKLLPQTFPSAVDIELTPTGTYVSRSTLSRDEAKSAGCGSINFNGALGEGLSKEVDRANNAGNLEICNDNVMLDAQPVFASSKTFTVSSSSGFVPYRKLCLEL